MTRQTIQSQVQSGQIPGAEIYRRFVEAIQADMVFINESYQAPGQTVFGSVPEQGGMFHTPKGSYEAIMLDVAPGAAPQPRWRRLSNNVQYSAGDTIPTTL